MNKRLPHLILAVGLLCTACHDNTKIEPDPNKERTVIVYVNADNNLYNMSLSDEYHGALMDINEMELGWKDDEYRNATLLVYLNAGDKRTPQIFRIKHDETMPQKAVDGKFDDGIRSPVVKTYENHDAALPGVLSRVISDAMQIAPAKNYGLVLWSHGTGWVPKGLLNGRGADEPLKSPGAQSTFGSSDYSYDNTQMEIPDLEKALPRDVVFDYIAFDACYMGGIEVAYELRNRCRRFIGSAVETPIDGFEYQSIMPDLLSANTDAIVQKNYDYYGGLSGWWKTCTMASIDCSKLDDLAAATKRLLESDRRTLAQLTTAEVQDLSSTEYFFEVYFDFGDFIAKNWAGSALLADFQAALDASVTLKRTHTTNLGRKRPAGYSIKTYSGYSCYVPKASQPKSLEAYRTNFAWSKASGMADIE